MPLQPYIQKVPQPLDVGVQPKGGWLALQVGVGQVGCVNAQHQSDSVLHSHS